MKFEVCREGKTVFVTESEECIYPSRILRAISKSGHTFRLDGKRASLEKVIAASKT